jgi:hypothetical protein
MAVAITFVGAARNISNLCSHERQPAAILQLDFVARRKFQEAVVVACIICSSRWPELSSRASGDCAARSVG